MESIMAVLADEGANHSTGRVKRALWERLVPWQKLDLKKQKTKLFSNLHHKLAEEPKLEDASSH